MSPEPEPENEEGADGQEEDVAEDTPAAETAPGVDAVQDLPPEGYSKLLNVSRDKKISILRREDGFEKRVLYHCSRCGVVFGYEIVGAEAQEGFEDTIYVLPNGVMGTDVMVRGKEGKRIDEGDMGISSGGAGVWE